MSSVAFASVVAAALMLAFRETRALGVVVVFVLLCLRPLAVAPLLVLAAAAHLLARRLLGRGPPPRP